MIHVLIGIQYLETHVGVDCYNYPLTVNARYFLLKRWCVCIIFYSARGFFGWYNLFQYNNITNFWVQNVQCFYIGYYKALSIFNIIWILFKMPYSSWRYSDIPTLPRLLSRESKRVWRLRRLFTLIDSKNNDCSL